jgi:hypothetical protein
MDFIGQRSAAAAFVIGDSECRQQLTLLQLQQPRPQPAPI